VGFKLVWTPLARDDLRRIVRYVARANPAAATRVGEGILSSVEPLQSMPRWGEWSLKGRMKPYERLFEETTESSTDCERKIMLLRFGASGMVHGAHQIFSIWANKRSSPADAGLEPV